MSNHNQTSGVTHKKNDHLNDEGAYLPNNRGDASRGKHGRRLLPPDPEGFNDERASHAEIAVRAFLKITGVDQEDVLGDLLGNLMHLCDRDPQFGGFEDGLAHAYRDYSEETANDAQYLRM